MPTCRVCGDHHRSHRTLYQGCCPRCVDSLTEEEDFFIRASPTHQRVKLESYIKQRRELSNKRWSHRYEDAK